MISSTDERESSDVINNNVISKYVPIRNMPSKLTSQTNETKENKGNYEPITFLKLSASLTRGSTGEIICTVHTFILHIL